MNSLTVYCSEPRLALNRIVVLRYRSHLESRQLAPGTVNLRLGAVRRLAYEAADCGLFSAIWRPLDPSLLAPQPIQHVNLFCLTK